MLSKLKYSVIAVISVLVFACAPKQSEIVVAEFGNYDIKMAEFEKAYTKNAGNVEKAKQDSVEELKKFLDLYVNFKMKLRDAEVRKLNTDPSILKELSDYEKTIGASYLIEKELYENGLKELYNKRSEELRISHILIRIDTLSNEEAEQKALSIIDRIKNGSSFEEEARKHSADQFSKNKGGDIYYITAGTVIPEFEDLAYATPLGEVNPTPLKTKYGYHIIKVTDRIKRVPKINASHILIRNQGPDGKADDKSRLELAKEVHEKAINGEDFGKLAAEYSEDPGSKEKGGELGNFSRRQMVQPFDQAAFNLKVGEVSDIVETQFGFHIIKLNSKQEYPEFEKEKKSLRELFDRTRKKTSQADLINGYAKELNFVKHDEVIKNVISNLNDIKIDESYSDSDFSAEFGKSILFTIENNGYTTDSLISFSKKDSKSLGKTLDQKSFNELLDKFKDEKVLEHKAKTLVKNDSEFAALMDEYKNGIFIFRLQEDEVWNKMRMDSIEIEKLYEETKSSYVWPNRVKYTELFVRTDSVGQICLNKLELGHHFDSLMVQYNQKKKNPNVAGLVNADQNNLSKEAYKLMKEGYHSGLLRNVNGWSIVRLDQKVPSKIKTFEEARAEVTSAYQDIESAQLENAYVSRLKNTYKPELFYEELENAYKN